MVNVITDTLGGGNPFGLGVNKLGTMFVVQLWLELELLLFNGDDLIRLSSD